MASEGSTDDPDGMEHDLEHPTEGEAQPQEADQDSEPGSRLESAVAQVPLDLQDSEGPDEDGDRSGDDAEDDEDELPPSEEGSAERQAEAEADARRSAGPAVLRDSSRPLPLRVEAVLFASGQALSPLRLAKVLDEHIDLIKPALAELATNWAAREGALELVEIAGGWRFMTRPTYQPDLAGLAKKARAERLSPAALETLAVVAYQQPIGRAEIEAVRGVAAGPLLRVLLDRDLIRITGRSTEPGHPLLYGTTHRFLDHFGLRSLKSLPDLKDLLDVS